MKHRLFITLVLVSAALSSSCAVKTIPISANVPVDVKMDKAAAEAEEVSLNATASQYTAMCSNHPRHWKGNTYSVQKSAQTEANDHNRDQHGGQSWAFVAAH